ncbi:hypothetical protein [Streptomyces sp. NPDC059894]|uniref:hypothetical protein n=1 Tax=unclassified Streptomyces TaxID=2593676 RepID=UPI003668C478
MRIARPVRLTRLAPRLFRMLAYCSGPHALALAAAELAQRDARIRADRLHADFWAIVDRL